MNSIIDTLKPYADLESQVCNLMMLLFSDTCAICTACCCRADICEEAIESAFLSKLITQLGIKADDMDERFGWLDVNGCSLKYGRPPVCYVYFCDELLARLPDDDARFVARTLGRLMNHIGINALGHIHLTEILSDNDLDKVDVPRIFQRLEEALSAFEVIEHYTHSGQLSASSRSILETISTDDP
ncbi:MAG TPA: hypothetical protein VIR63_03565 [Pontiella sp.]